MTKAEKKNKKKRSPALAAAIILLFVILVLLIATLAYFSSFDEVTNVFEGGRIDIVLTEPKWNPGDAKNIVPGEYLNKDPYITNNEELPAYVFLKVTVPAVKVNYDNSSGADKGSPQYDGTSEFLPMYKFVTVNESGTPNDASDDILTKDESFTSTQVYNDAWQILGGYPKAVGNDDNKAFEYVYVYKANEAIGISALEPGQKTIKPLFDKIYLQNFRNDNAYNADRDYSVRVEAYGIQTRYLASDGGDINDPAVIWNKIEQS